MLFWFRAIYDNEPVDAPGTLSGPPLAAGVPDFETVRTKVEAGGGCRGRAARRRRFAVPVGWRSVETDGETDFQQDRSEEGRASPATGTPSKGSAVAIATLAAILV
jgi:hypothetical protein